MAKIQYQLDATCLFLCSDNITRKITVGDVVEVVDADVALYLNDGNWVAVDAAVAASQRLPEGPAPVRNASAASEPVDHHDGEAESAEPVVAGVVVDPKVEANAKLAPVVPAAAGPTSPGG